MIQYSFNLINESENRRKRLRSAAEKVARAASAVDTGLYKKSWHAFMQGDTLIVRNRISYAAYVELGTIVSKKHQYKIRDALRRLGLREGQISSFGVQIPIPQADRLSVPGQTVTGLQRDISQEIRERGVASIPPASGNIIIPPTVNPLDVIPALIQQRRAIAPSIQAVNQRQQFLGQRASSVKRLTTILGLSALLIEEQNEIPNKEE